MWTGRVLAVLTLYVARVGEANSKLGGGLVGRGNSRDPAPCSCDCCEVSERRPEEVVAANIGGASVSVGVKCSPSTSHSADLCPPDECQTQDSDRVLGPSAQGGGGAVEYMRYCFYECKPLAGLRSPSASECVELEDADVKAVTDGSGDAKDPAVAMLASIAEAAHKRTHSLLSAKTRAKISPREAEVLVKNMQRQADVQAATAKTEAASGRALEEDKAQTYNDRLKASVAARQSGKNTNPYAAMMDIHGSMQRAEEQARLAGESLQSAMESLHEGRQRAWDAAVSEGQSAMASVKAEFQAWASTKGKIHDSTNEVETKMAEAAAAAAEPYHLSMLRSQESVQDYTSRAEKAAAQAVQWEAKSKALQAKAQALKAKGEMEFAEDTIAEAKEWMKRAKDIAAQAKHFFATADAVNREIPKFSAAAQAAAVQAAFQQQPAWQGTRFGSDKR